MQKISIVVPCYNEEQVLRLYYQETESILQKIDEIYQNQYVYEYIFIDDGSKDHTLDILKELRNQNDTVKIISFSRNFGKEAGIYAGLTYATGDLVVVMDADLQHSPSVMLQMLEGIREGYDSVTTKRKNRKDGNVVMNVFSKLFYVLMGKMVDFTFVQGAQDFRMMTRKVVDSVLSLKEYHRFSKGIFEWVGYHVKYIEVEDQKRAAGKSKWNFFALFKYALDGMISFSTAPLKISIFLGIVISIISLVFGFMIVMDTVIYGKDVPGYASTITAVLFIGGIELLSIGILAEYIGRMYMEMKKRPIYLVKEKYVEQNREK